MQLHENATYSMNCHVSISWSHTRIKLENGNTLTNPQLILQVKWSHAIRPYKLHYCEVDFRPSSFYIDVIKILELPREYLFSRRQQLKDRNHL